MNSKKITTVKSNMAKSDFEKLKELTHYIIRKCGNAPNFGSTLLWKMLYFSDFDHYELTYRSITNEQYRKIEHGPAPCHINEAIAMLEKEEKIIAAHGAKYFNHNLKKFIAVQEPLLKCIKAEEIKVVDRVIQRLMSMNATQVSEYSHLDTPWKVTKDKEIIDYEYALHRSPLTSVRPD